MSHSKILTSLLDEIVCLAWLLLHNVNERFFFNSLLGRQSYGFFITSPKNLRYFFRLISSSSFSTSPSRNSISFLTLQPTSLSKSGCKCMDYHFNPQIIFDLFLNYFFSFKNKPQSGSVNEPLANKQFKELFKLKALFR
jgi:hypothetical protein